VLAEQSNDSTVTSPMEMVIEFLENSRGLNYKKLETGALCIFQKVDGKQIHLDTEEIVSVIPREDYKKDAFIQINFSGGKKILLTDHLIGFKPAEIDGINIESLPKVVATPDLVGLFEALEDCLSAKNTNITMLLELRQASMSIIEGAESIGIDLSQEKIWLKRIGLKQKMPQAC
jgi:hypothetical protein